MILFGKYYGPTLHDSNALVPTVCHTWPSSGIHCSCLYLSLKLAWAIATHKSSLRNEVVTVIKTREFVLD